MGREKGHIVTKETMVRLFVSLVTIKQREKLRGKK